MTPTDSRHRLAPLLLALAVLAAILVTVPLPTVVEAQTFATRVRTDRVSLALTRGLGRGQALAPAATADPAVRTVLDAAARRRTTVHAPYDALGITLPAPPTEPILVRGLVAGRWTPWSEAEFLSDEAPDAQVEPTRAGADSQPIWFGGATAYEIDGPATVQSASVHLVDDELTGTERRLEPATAGALAAPAINSRATWGARPPKRTPTIVPDLKIAIVHHSVNSNTYSPDQVPALLRSIQAYHQDVQGWDDFAYNFAVDRWGRTWEGRAGGIDQVVLGGHSHGFNTASVGVVVLGDFTSVKPSSASVESVARVIAWKFALHRVDPASTVPFTTTGSGRYAAGKTIRLPRIVGHRDVQTTSCPGNGLYAQLGTIRKRVAQLVPAYQSGLPSKLVELDGNGDGLTDGIEQRLGPSPDTRWQATGPGSFTRSAVQVTGPYRPVVGDFDGNGIDDVLWHGGGSTPDVIWWGGIGSQTIDVLGSYVPLAGDFDGNGIDDILWYAPGIAADSIWYGSAGRHFTPKAVDQDLIGGQPVIGDFNGNGKDDVLWYGPGASTDVVWWSWGSYWTTKALTISGTYRAVAVHDVGGARDDILFIQPSGTASSRWTFDASRNVHSTPIPIPGVDGTPTTGDFDGDGREDVFVLARNGQSAIWYSTADGVSPQTYTTSAGYSAVAGRMEGLDALDDLLLVSATQSDYLWRGKADRTVAVSQVG